jgi:hypothetical protein
VNYHDSLILFLTDNPEFDDNIQSLFADDDLIYEFIEYINNELAEEDLTKDVIDLIPNYKLYKEELNNLGFEDTHQILNYLINKTNNYQYVYLDYEHA